MLKRPAQNNTNIAFSGLKSNLRIGDSVLREFNNEYPFFKSNSKILFKMRELEQKDSRYQALIPKLEEIEERNSRGVQDVRNSYCLNIYPSLTDFINKLRLTIQTKKYANCIECADLIKYKLQTKGEEPFNIGMWMKDINSDSNIESINHAFTIFGTKKDAILTNPKKWGSNTTIVDGWANIVTDARNGIEYFKQKMGFNPNYHKITYTVEDSDAFYKKNDC